MVSDATFDPLYLKGIRFFNRGDFFEAHDVWEELWMQCEESARLFYQGLIQAAVSLLHFENGNQIGARKLCRSSREKLSLYGPRFQGLEIFSFIDAVQSHMNPSTCFVYNADTIRRKRLPNFIFSSNVMSLSSTRYVRLIQSWM